MLLGSFVAKNLRELIYMMTCAASLSHVLSVSSRLLFSFILCFKISSYQLSMDNQIDLGLIIALSVKQRVATFSCSYLPIQARAKH